MKKVSFILFLFAGLSFLGCSKQNMKQSKTEDKVNNTETVSESKAPVKQVDPEIEKLTRVISSMSERCKAEMSDGSLEDLLADLHKVLDAEARFPKDDLSLYYLIDKKHSVDESYVPAHLVKVQSNSAYVVNKKDIYLREDAESALREMAGHAKADGITLDVSSTYRSYAYQKNLFDYWVKVDGLEEAERESARPGTSQHQLGCAIDFGSIDDDYDKTPGGQWMYKHANEYGWSLSFPKGYEDITGYRWECWHFRYIGIEACKFQKKWFNNVQQFMLEFIDEWKKQS